LWGRNWGLDGKAGFAADRWDRIAVTGRGDRLVPRESFNSAPVASLKNFGKKSRCLLFSAAFAGWPASGDPMLADNMARLG